jgi:glycosyltransferase involved in cell wall biosynthesis
MRIIVVNETSDLGGAETMAVELANALSAFSTNEIAFASAPGIMQKRLDDKIQFFPIARYNLWNICRLFSQFGSIFKKNHFGIMHSQGATIGIIAGITARLFSPQTKVFITHHSSTFTRIPSCIANLLFETIADMLIAISKAKYNSYIRSGFSKEKIALIPNFVDRGRLLSQASPENVAKLKVSLGILDDEKVIVGVGRLLRGKRFDIFIQTLVDCVLQAPDIKIYAIIIGDGPERANLQGMINCQNLSNLRIKLLGYQRNVAAYLKISDIFLFTSEEEVLPMCLIEATSLGVPIVCSDIPGNSDIVKSEFNGFLVDLKKKDYSIFVLRLLRDDALAKRISFNGIEKAKNEFDKDKVVEDIVGLYKNTRRTRVRQ